MAEDDVFLPGVLPVDTLLSDQLDQIMTNINELVKDLENTKTNDKGIGESWAWFKNIHRSKIEQYKVLHNDEVLLRTKMLTKTLLWILNRDQQDNLQNAIKTLNHRIKDRLNRERPNENESEWPEEWKTVCTRAAILKQLEENYNTGNDIARKALMDAENREEVTRDKEISTLLAELKSFSQ